MTANLPAYLTSWSEEILARADRVRHLIGERHWPSDGSYKEMLIREFLLRHVPNDLCVTRGFVRHLHDEIVSPEVDLLITDAKQHVPLFHEGDFQVVAPSSVLATFEIKSTYRKDVLSTALTNVRRVRATALHGVQNSDVWSAIVFISASAATAAATLCQDLDDILKDHAFWHDADLPHSSGANSKLAPQMVCILDSCLALLDTSAPPTISVKAFTAGRLSGGLAFAQLFGYLRASLTDRHDPGELDQALERCEGLSNAHRLIQVPTAHDH